MTDTFANLLSAEFNNWTRTENGAIARSSTGSGLLDLYGTVGALRTRPSDVVGMFASAFNEDALLATKLSFYARNIRGGLGERLVSRYMWRWLAINVPEIMEKNLHLVPFFGRWDDVYTFVNTPVENEMWELVAEQFVKDVEDAYENKPISLLGKWLASVNTSSEQTRSLGKYSAKRLGLTERDYRRTVSFLRAYLDNAVVETKMSSNRWSDIDFEKVCSKAMSNSRKAFSKHDGERFSAYIESVKKGEAKINSGTLYPYDILEKMGLEQDYQGGKGGRMFEVPEWDDVLEQQWNALPNYAQDGENVLIVADTSGSMKGRPVCTSIGLAVYFAERNSGQFHGKFITFSSRPSFVEIKGNTMKDKIACIPAIVENTDLNAVFELVLDVAVKNSVPQEDMPKKIVIVSDMEIDAADQSSRNRTFTNYLVEKYARAGYTLPNMVYWNVDSRANVFHAEKNDKGIQLASGQSPSIFKNILKSVSYTPWDAMVEVLNSEEYSAVRI